MQKAVLLYDFDSSDKASGLDRDAFVLALNRELAAGWRVVRVDPLPGSSVPGTESDSNGWIAFACLVILEKSP